MVVRKGVTQQMEKGKQGLGSRYHSIRRSLKARIDKASSLDGGWVFIKNHNLYIYRARSSASTRLHCRCFLTGRLGANYRYFGPSRHVPREMDHACCPD
uniref:Ribosomal protein S14 n=2 Tax=Selaginella TaxID=3246 RepID=Q2WGC6_SELUN|nr:ribosomal protein S14 [Selaginella uncinata]YP_009589573.1 ribosomal protein S14 [Selaginella hainanensis]AKI29362.1 ribosomal protein S14 [Selaginella uncinata]QBL07928.1 ribosomal protein S14 [Selaginella uncinata]QBL76152.1 ribosomal protein S14 [Selaginella hainanensis]BAE00250.1 ribosomal protein S14 [Selaginella uncinata]